MATIAERLEAQEAPSDKLNRLARELREKEEALEAERAENARLRAGDSGPLTFKVGAKGGVSVYGLGRFPVTLYAGQWERLLRPPNLQNLIRFLNDHAPELARKEG